MSTTRKHCESTSRSKPLLFTSFRIVSKKQFSFIFLYRINCPGVRSAGTLLCNLCQIVQILCNCLYSLFIIKYEFEGFWLMVMYMYLSHLRPKANIMNYRYMLVKLGKVNIKGKLTLVSGKISAVIFAKATCCVSLPFCDSKWLLRKAHERFLLPPENRPTLATVIKVFRCY